MRTRGILLLVGFTLALPDSRILAQGARHSHPLISDRTAAAAGLILVATLLGDQGLRGELLEHRGPGTGSGVRLANGFGDPRYVLPALGAGFLVGEVIGSRGVRRAAVHAGEAAILAGGLVTAVKLTVGRRRPSGDGDADEFRPFSGWNSFPSGHTAVAFAVATALADETPGGWSDAALYGLAGLTAVARLSDDRHWTSDVFVGALVGHLSAKWLARRHGWLSIGPGAIATTLEF
jgi:membrane-associated phospholipid phosphatase